MADARDDNLFITSHAVQKLILEILTAYEYGKHDVVSCDYFSIILTEKNQNHSVA